MEITQSLARLLAHIPWAVPVLYPVARHVGPLVAEYLRSALLLNPTPRNLLRLAKRYEGATGQRYLPSIQEGVASLVPKGEDHPVSLAQVRQAPELYSTDEGIRTVDFLAQREGIKRLNTEAVLFRVLAEAAQDADFPTEPTDVDETWLNRFFEWVGSISDEEVQALWARVMAGEVKRPGSFSLRTLDVLRSLSREEADIFNRFAAKRVSFPTGDTEACVLRNIKLSESYGIGYRDRTRLNAAGLTHPEFLVSLDVRSVGEESSISVTHGDIVITGQRPPGDENRKIEIYDFTDPGLELARLVPVEKNQVIIDFIVDLFKSFGWQVELSGPTAEVSSTQRPIDSGSDVAD